MKFKPKFYKGEEECPFEENSMEWLFWGLERILSANDDDWKNRCMTEFRSYLSEGPVWPEVCNDESKPFEERATLFWIAADYAMHAPMACAKMTESDWKKYFASPRPAHSSLFTVKPRSTIHRPSLAGAAKPSPARHAP